MSETVKLAGMLPVGQQIRDNFPRFGVTQFTDFEAPVDSSYSVELKGDIESRYISQDDLAGLQRIDLVSDFHCVTTWTYPGVQWSGYRFRDVYEALIQPHISPDKSIALIAFKSLDKYKASLLLEDALADDVFLVDRMNGKPLSAKHGAPLRLLAPAHYGYKSVKHLASIQLWQSPRSYHPILLRFMEHPRARVAYEERGRYFPGWLLRYLYRPLINATVRKMNAGYESEPV